MRLTSDQHGMVDVKLELPVGNSIVLLEVSGRKDLDLREYNSNVFCINSSDEVVWQVSAPDSPHGRDSFVSIEMTKDGLRADRFFGQEFLIDISTGRATEIGWHK